MLYTRDEILTQGLDLASSPTVDAHDRPGGVIQENAYSIKWLQNALDMYHKRYPFSTDVTSVAIAMPGGSTDVVLASDSTKYVPTDFMIAVRNGLIVNVAGQLLRVRETSFQYWLNFYNTFINSPAQWPMRYTFINSRLKIAPLLSASQAGTLWYYKQPAKLEADSEPSFPDEWTLIEFVRLKAQEWTRSIDPGTAQMYMQKELGRLRSAGLLHNTEYDSIPIENNQAFTDTMIGNNYAWMGNYAI